MLDVQFKCRSLTGPEKLQGVQIFMPMPLNNHFMELLAAASEHSSASITEFEQCATQWGEDSVSAYRRNDTYMPN